MLWVAAHNDDDEDEDDDGEEDRDNPPDNDLERRLEAYTLRHRL